MSPMEVWGAVSVTIQGLADWPPARKCTLCCILDPRPATFCAPDVHPLHTLHTLQPASDNAASVSGTGLQTARAGEVANFTIEVWGGVGDQI